jgi:hexosaminidase
MKHATLLLAALAPLFAFAAPSADITESPAILPRPASLAVEGKTGFSLAGTVAVNFDKAFSDAANALHAGLSLHGVTANLGSGAPDSIAFKRVEGLGKEAYRITVTPTGVTVEASDAAGAFYGAQTLVQSVVKDSAGKPALPAMTVNDAPRFGWRGLMVDSGRHFFPPASMKRFIDLMAMHKLNTLHWHLTEDQGWRIEIKKYPKLTTVGATRAGEHIAGKPYHVADNKPYGPFFYTQEEIRDIVAYAKARSVTVIPEIEMPGHAAAAIAAYPELGNKDIPVYKPEVKTAWGVHYYTFSPSEETFTFLDDVIGEVAALFPDAPYIHVGGDEAPKDQWNKSAFVKKLMAEKNIKDTHEVQSYFIGRAEKMINARGKRIIGWDEIQEGGLSKTATMMVWRNWKWAIEAVNHGNDVVMAPTSNTYFDYGQGKSPAGPGHQTIGGNLGLQKVYDFEPIPRELKPEQYKHILGCQAQLWSEYIRTPGKWEYQAFPRAIALAEVAWSPKDGKDFKGFSDRLAKHATLLDALKVNYRKDDGAPAQPDAKLLNE